MAGIVVANRYGAVANVNGRPDADYIRVLEQLITNQSALLSRKNLSGLLGRQFGGDRKIYDAAGYKTDIAFEDYLAKYTRQDIAKAVVKAAPSSTWRGVPKLMDGFGNDATEDSDFVRAWQILTNIANVGDDLTDRKSIWHYLTRSDILAGLDEYAVLLVGVRDGAETLADEVRAGAAPGVAGFLYLRPYAKKDATVEVWDEDVTSPRFGLPETYRITVSDVQQVPVHWTRVVHIAEDLLQDEVNGAPRLESVYNRLDDLEKILPAAAEAAWKLMYKGLIMTTQEGYELPDSEVTNDKVEEYIHGLRRVLELEGLDVTFEGGEVVDPSNLVDVMLMFVSIATGIPKRILTGSERGELASSQDEANWVARIVERQGDYAEPIILRPFVNRLIYAGVLPRPDTGTYTIQWPALFELNDLEQAEVAERYASAIRQVAPAGAPDLVVTPDEARSTVLAGLGLPNREQSLTEALLDVEEEMEDEPA